jgi:hypothetical protein
MVESSKKPQVINPLIIHHLSKSGFNQTKTKESNITIRIMKAKSISKLHHRLLRNSALPHQTLVLGATEAMEVPGLDISDSKTLNTRSITLTTLIITMGKISIIEILKSNYIELNRTNNNSSTQNLTSPLKIQSM